MSAPTIPLFHLILAIIVLLPVPTAATEPALEIPAANTETTASPSAPMSATTLKTMVDQTAHTHGLDRDLIHALIRAESAYNPQAVSPAGAVGLMQVMPATAADYGVNHSAALFEPKTNLNTGMRHFKRLLNKYDNIAAAVMAYNAGEGALERGGGVVNYAETQRYTHQVLTTYLKSKGIAPYSPEARAVTGIDLNPKMATAQPAISTRKPLNKTMTQPAHEPEPEPLKTYTPEPDLRWQATFKQPELKPELKAQLEAQNRHLLTTVKPPPALNVSSLRIQIPAPQYLKSPPRAQFTSRMR
ncbi:hypothetical protein CKO12_09945 [Chromatium okenii]|uniref:lytic transglycosylase domain-containing protein n=1 Tax=Chromatium okenii TaxID=61644 RepID=UPI001903AD2D|nr:lytic transglycosylase domain-containing protein [Chromatium okenii]MBK1642194.1 hypothetical protein [Chromatium okenii]